MEVPALPTRRSLLAVALTEPRSRPPAPPPSRSRRTTSRRARYRFEGSVHTMWVYDYDAPHTPGSPTDPRPTVVQILRENRPAGTRATDIMLNVANINGGTYFKNGVYHHGSGRAEARFRNITHWRQ